MTEARFPSLPGPSFTARAEGRRRSQKRVPKKKAVAVLAALATLTSCALPYVPEAVPERPPLASPAGVTLEPSGIEVAAFFYQSRDQLKGVFPHKWKWLWRSHVAVIRLTLATHRPGLTEVKLDSGYIALKDGSLYPLTSPGRAFDIAWGRGNPYVAVSSALYNTAVMLFTVLTLGLGNLVFVLPSPFAQPAPMSEPLGRDLNDQMFPQDLRLSAGAVVSGLLYVALPPTADLAHLEGAALHLFLETKKEGEEATPLPLVITLGAGGKTDGKT